MLYSRGASATADVGFNRDPHFQRVMRRELWPGRYGGLGRFNRDPHFQRVMLGLGDHRDGVVRASIGTLIFRG